MPVATDFKKNLEGTRATFTPTGGSAIEFSEVSMQPGGGVEWGIGEDVTGGADYVDGVAVAKMSGSRKMTHKPFTVEVRYSPTQEDSLIAAGGVKAVGVWAVTFVDGSGRSNDSVQIIDIDNGSDTVNEAGQLSSTLTLQPDGNAEWVTTPAP